MSEKRQRLVDLARREKSQTSYSLLVKSGKFLIFKIQMSANINWAEQWVVIHRLIDFFK